MWDICADCTEEFVSNEVIRVVLPPLPPQNHFIIELNSSYTLWIVKLLNHGVKTESLYGEKSLSDQQGACLLHSMYFVCAWLKLLLPPNIWFRGLEKLDEMSGLRFFAQPSCLHPRFYASKGKTCRGSPCKEPVNVHLYTWPKKTLVSLSPIVIEQPLVFMTFGQEVETGAHNLNIGNRQIKNQFSCTFLF